MAGRKITIEFLGNTRDLNNALDSAESKTGKLSSRLKSFGKVAALGMAAGAAVAGKALFDMTRGAIEDEAAQKRLETQLRASAGATKEQVAATEDWISRQGVAKGVMDDELRPALARLVTATGDVGEAQRLASLAMDVSAATGKSLESVSTALMKAQNGQVSSLSRLGVNTRNAAGETLTMAEVTKRMSDQFGGAANKQANTLEGKMARLRLVMAETGETIGAKLIPVVTRMADWFLNKALPALSEFGAWLSSTLPPIFERVRAVISNVMGKSDGDVSSALGNIRSTVESFVSIVRSLWDRFGSTIMRYTKTTFANIKQVVGGALKVISGIFQTVAALLKGDWKGAWDGIKKIASGAVDMLKGIVKQMWNFIRTAFTVGASAVKGLFTGLWNGIKSMASNGATALVNAIKGIPGRLRALGGVFRSAGGAIMDALLGGLKSAGGFAADFAANVWGAIKGMINSAISRINGALPNSIGKGPLTVDLPDNPIPQLAKGGIVKARPGGTLALIGEAGQDEAVIPLPRGGRRMGSNISPLPGGMGGGNVYITVQSFDPAESGRLVERALLKWQRDSGRVLFS